jgi:hypothetical protein
MIRSTTAWAVVKDKDDEGLVVSFRTRRKGTNNLEEVRIIRDQDWRDFLEDFRALTDQLRISTQENMRLLGMTEAQDEGPS